VYPHRIRLRDPWQRETLEGGRARWSRRFGYPGRIDDFERVWLTFAGSGSAAIRLNEQPLGSTAGGDIEFEVTALLRQRNEVVVETAVTTDGMPWEEAALEVRRTAWLRAVRVVCVREGERVRLCVTGEVAGSADRPLELYVILDRSNVAYELTEAAPEGRAFSLDSEELASDRCEPAGTHGVRVDLVDGATVWYTVERIV
jgi:hypothetical protein